MHTILICDDDRDIVSALDIYLASEGYRTLKAYNGLEAIQAVERNEVHLILMDIMMPELDGIRATARLREGSNIPIILLTAKSEDADKILGLNIGADDYITKPFNPLEVIARVKSQLRRYTSLGGRGEGSRPADGGPHRHGRRGQAGDGGRGAGGPDPHRVQHPAPADDPSGTGVLLRPDL